jgi:hypothetical protein
VSRCWQPCEITQAEQRQAGRAYRHGHQKDIRDGEHAAGRGLISCEGKYGQRLYSLTSYGMRFAPDTIPGMKQGKSKLIQRTDTNVICQECRNSAAMKRVLMVWGRVGV